MSTTPAQPSRPAEPTRTIAALSAAAKAVRTANHATTHTGEFDHGDLHRLTAELTRRLPQLLDQRHGDLAITVDIWDCYMASAVQTADLLERQIAIAFNPLSSVKAATRRTTTH